MCDQDINSDDDSLFGSAPSSPALVPTKGRSSLLALPGGADAPTLALPKNVGAIALPGSHDSSEHVVNLPASPPRLAGSASTLQGQNVPNKLNERRSSTPLNLKPKPQKIGKKRAKTSSATPEPVNRPALSIPEPNGPLPPNFLRNQQALLGLAGVVGGVNPSQLSIRGSRGTTAQNPIVIDEETPSISASSWKSKQPQLSGNMPMPSSQAISDTLITQGNIVPVLRSLLPYFGAIPSLKSQSNNFHRQVHSKSFSVVPDLAPPPLKRRKLNSVPAGAADWDVPYPFPENEGPQHYLQEWEKERGKKLVVELVSLVRDAVRRAAAKTQAVEDHSKDDVSGMDSYKTKAECLSEAPVTSFEDSIPSSRYSTDHCPSPSNMGFPFDPDLESLFGSVHDPLSDSLAQFLGDESAKMPTSNFTSPTLTSSTRLSTPSDFTLPSAALGNKENSELLPQFSQTDLNSMPIDPALLDFPWSFPSSSGNNELPSSFDVFGNFNFPGMVSPVESCFTDEDTAASTPNLCPSSTSASTSESPVPSQSSDITSTTSRTVFKPNYQAKPATYDVRFMPPVIVNEAPSLGGHNKASNSKTTEKMLDRGEVLHRARVRRKQLADELARAKIELWEATIEQGVLTHLSKDKELWKKDS